MGCKHRPAPRRDHLTSPTIFDGPLWWASNDRGVGDRPKYGTRVRIKDGAVHGGQLGTVACYEGQWPSSTFPVRLDGFGLMQLYVTSEVIELSAAPVVEPIIAAVSVTAVVDVPEPPAQVKKATRKRKRAA